MADGADPVAARAATQRQHFADAVTRVRDRADTAAKSLGVIGTTGLTAAGLVKIGDVFPFAGGLSNWLALLALIGGFAGLAIVIAFFTLRLWRLNTPLVTSPDLAKWDELTKQELPHVEKMYEEFADLNTVPSVRAYQARVSRWESVADNLGEGVDGAVRAHAARAAAEIGALQARAALVVVRNRAARTIKDRRAAAMYLLFAVAALMCAIGSDRLSEQTGDLDTAKSCAELVKAGTTALPRICNSYPVDTDEPAPSPGAVETEALVALAQSVAVCEAAATKRHADQTSCARLRQLLVTAAAPG